MGKLLYHIERQGTEESGGRRNSYLIGDSNDPFARENALENCPRFLMVKVRYEGQDEGVFYIYQEAVGGGWRLLQEEGPLHLDMQI